MKMYRLKYLFTFLAFLSISATAYSSNDGEEKSSTVTVVVAPILSFEVDGTDVDFAYDEHTGVNTDKFDKNWFRVTGNAHWEFSIYAESGVLTSFGSPTEIPISHIRVRKLHDCNVFIDLTTSPQVLLSGVGTIPTNQIKLQWWFQNMSTLGNLRAGSYTVGVIYQITSSDFPVGPA